MVTVITKEPDGVVDDALDVVEDQDLPPVPGVEHGLGAVVGDAVALQHVLDGAHLPGQPPLTKCSIDTQHVGQMARVTTTTSFIILDTLSYSLHFSLLAVGSSEL